MAKRPRESRKTLKSNRRKQAERTILNSSRNEASQCATVPPLPSHTTSTSTHNSQQHQVCCSCQSKFAKLISLQLLDESTNDGADVTWDDHSRQLCICPKGKSSNRVEEILNSLPSVDSPVAKQQNRFSLGQFVSMEGSQEESRLKRRPQKRDQRGLQVLNSLLNEIKSPLQVCKTHDNSDDNDEPNTQDKHTLNTVSSPLESDNFVDFLFADSNILDDLTTFSPLPTSHTPSSTEKHFFDSACIAKDRQNRECSDDGSSSVVTSVTANVKTPFRKSLSLRKRLVPSDSHKLTDSPSTRGINEQLQCCDSNSSVGSDDDFFWTQVASTVDADHIAVSRGDDDMTCNDLVTDVTVGELFTQDDVELLNHNGSQPRVCSQQDIEAKRLLAKRKLQQKFKTI